MIVIYHNPDSPNSNKCLEILETSKHDQEAIKYQDKPLDKIKLQKIIKLLKINPEELIRKESKVWKENFDHLHQDDHKFNNEELLDLMVEYQEIIETSEFATIITPNSKTTGNGVIADMKKGQVKILSNAKRLSTTDERSEQLE